MIRENIIDTVNSAWDDRASPELINTANVRDSVEHVLQSLDDGSLRVAEKQNDVWVIHQWIKKALLLSFRLNGNQVIAGPTMNWFDKVPLKFEDWGREDFEEAGFRAVPGSIVRYSAYIAPNVVLMPCFVNIGAHVGKGTMVDTWSTIGSCAQIGENCHISGGVGIGGVLEPLQTHPVIIEDNCFIGARSEVAEGVVIGEGSVISMGVFLGASTKIVNRHTGEILYGYVPPYSVVVPGTIPSPDPSKPSLACAVIVKQVDARTRSKTDINELLRI